jgi:geranylgeranylglycerol-phosphate geranylgeranyltransferase
VVFAVLAYLYSYKLKDMPLLGNIYIAFSMAIPFIYGAVVSSGTVPPVIWLVVLVTFLSGLAREIHGMIRDHRGDSSERNISNVVTHMGGTRSAYFSLVLYAEAIAISIYMFFLFRPFAGNLAYLIPILAVDSMLGYVGIAGVVSKRPDRFHRYVSRNLSLIAMTLALLTYLVSAILYLPV